MAKRGTIYVTRARESQRRSRAADAAQAIQAAAHTLDCGRYYRGSCIGGADRVGITRISLVRRRVDWLRGCDGFRDGSGRVQIYVLVGASTNGPLLVEKLAAFPVIRQFSQVQRVDSGGYWGPLRANIYSQARSVSLDNAPVHLLGGDTLLPDYLSAHLRLAALYRGRDESVPYLVFRLRVDYLAHRLIFRLCDYPRAGFHRRYSLYWPGAGLSPPFPRPGASSGAALPLRYCAVGSADGDCRDGSGLDRR